MDMKIIDKITVFLLAILIFIILRSNATIRNLKDELAEIKEHPVKFVATLSVDKQEEIFVALSGDKF